MMKFLLIDERYLTSSKQLSLLPLKFPFFKVYIHLQQHSEKLFYYCDF